MLCSVALARFTRHSRYVRLVLSDMTLDCNQRSTVGEGEAFLMVVAMSVLAAAAAAYLRAAAGAGLRP